MAMLSTPRLDALAAMQERPFGTNTAMYRDPSTEALTRGYRQEKSDYQLARRMLRQQARRGRGDAAALTNITRSAEARGINMGMEGQDQMGAAVNRRRQVLEDDTRRRNLEAGRMEQAANTIPAESDIEMAGPPESAAGGLPSTNLGVMANQALGEMGGESTGFRQGLVRAMDRASTPEEQNELRNTAVNAGITTQQFDAKADELKKMTALQRLLLTGRARK